VAAWTDCTRGEHAPSNLDPMGSDYECMKSEVEKGGGWNARAE
jgi:hypothetical protein